MRVVSSFIFSVLVSSLAFSAAPKFKKVDYKWMSASELKSNRKKANARSGERKLANTISEEMMSSEYRSFRDRYLKTVKDSQGYHKLLTDLEKDYDKHPADLKYIAARMKPIQSMRGVLYRLTKVMKREQVTHSYFLTVVRRLVGQMRLYFPYDHADATFEYFAKPYLVDGKVVKEFKSIEEFQSYLAGPVYEMLAESARRISSMDFSKSKVIWDNQILNGSESFVDDVARYRILGEAERNASMFRLHRGMAFLTRFAAYNQEKILEYTKDMGKLYGVDGFLSEVDGAPSYKRVKVANKKKYKKLFELHEEGQDWMKQSFNHVKESVKYLRIIHDELKDRPSNSFQRINPIRVAAWEREINSGLDTLEAVVSGVTELRSPITGEVIKVNLPEFYNNPPKNLKNLLPINWDTENKDIETPWKRNVFRAGKKIKRSITYRNYYWGRATEWNAKGYKRYFPSIKDNKDIPRHIRIFRQSMGASTVGNVITQFTE